jgi:hypothetical protein
MAAAQVDGPSPTSDRGAPDSKTDVVEGPPEVWEPRFREGLEAQAHVRNAARGGSRDDGVGLMADLERGAKAVG